MNTQHKRGLHTVAVFEAGKGLIVLLAGFGIFALIHHNVQAIAERLVAYTHLNPARHYPHIFIEAAGKLTDARLLRLAGLALLYSAVRFVEAYGLWKAKTWAEWFAIISGAIYVPIEVYELVRHPRWLTLATLLGNLGIVGYLVWLGCSERRRLQTSRSP